MLKSDPKSNYTTRANYTSPYDAVRCHMAPNNAVRHDPYYPDPYYHQHTFMLVASWVVSILSSKFWTPHKY
uniref:Uncharacterized protein n=1 Tax=Romanomermis culicivorax TaxID=13658 RepID=A0A915HU26_ROMCU